MRPHQSYSKGSLAKGLMALLFVFIILFSNFGALADTAETFEVKEFRGYFETYVWLYEQPGRDSNTLIKIPQYTPLVIRLSSDPSHKGYGQTEYEDQAGFVRMFGFFDMPAEREDYRAGQTMYAKDVRVLRAESLHGAQVLKRLLPETPFVVLARTRFMVKVDVEGQIGFIYGNDLQELTPDLDLEPFMMYSREEQELLSYPAVRR